MTSTTHGTRWTDDELSRLDGWWTTKERDDLFRVKPIGNGEAVIAKLDWESDDEGFAVFNFKAVFTHFGDHDFVFLRGRGFFSDYPGYCFARIVNCDGASIAIANSIDESFLASVSRKQIAGEIRNDKHSGKWAYITATSDNLLVTMNKNGIDTFFDASKQISYTKTIRDPKD